MILLSYFKFTIYSVFYIPNTIISKITNFLLEIIKIIKVLNVFLRFVREPLEMSVFTIFIVVITILQLFHHVMVAIINLVKTKRQLFQYISKIINISRKILICANDSSLICQFTNPKISKFCYIELSYFVKSPLDYFQKFLKLHI